MIIKYFSLTFNRSFHLEFYFSLQVEPLVGITCKKRNSQVSRTLFEGSMGAKIAALKSDPRKVPTEISFLWTE